MTLIPIRRPGQPDPAAEAAADWVLRQEAGLLSDGEQQAFEAWLAAHPDHVDAYEAAIWALDAPARHAAEPELMAMREAALAARAESPRNYWTWSSMAAGLAASIAALWLLTGKPDFLDILDEPVGNSAVAQRAADPRAATYSTAIGERLAITLPDGSVATLDTDSRIRVAYSSRERGVHLLRGQALFEVAHGRPLPFQVHAAGQTITAVGTSFNVRLYGNVVRVALLEGSVRVRSQAPAQSAAAPPRQLMMRAGEVLQLGPAATTRIASADVAQVASWRGGELVFNDVSLSSAVAEINRYTRRPIAIGDIAVGEHRVTGVFRSNDPERFAQAMAEVFPIEVTHAQDGAPILRARQ